MPRRVSNELCEVGIAESYSSPMIAMIVVHARDVGDDYPLATIPRYVDRVHPMLQTAHFSTDSCPHPLPISAIPPLAA
jgi:hypothetical protein